VEATANISRESESDDVDDRSGSATRRDEAGGLATRGGDARAEKRVVDERRRARASGSGLRTAKLDAFDDANLVHVGPDKTGRPPAGSPRNRTA
jgi:hypothetical protein